MWRTRAMMGLLATLVLLVSAVPAVAGEPEKQKDGQTWTKNEKLTEKEKSYSYEMKAGAIYLINLKSEQFDPVLILKAPDGQNVGFDDDSGEGLNARLLFAPSVTGKYEVAATSFQMAGRGDFTLTIQPIEPVFYKEGELTKDDPLDKQRNQSYHKSYEVKLKGDQTYLVYLIAKDFDPYLRVEDNKGTVLGQDDDSAGNYNARLLLRPKKDGTCKVVATSYAGNKTGKYTLSVLAPSDEMLKQIDPQGKLLGSKAPDLEGDASLNGDVKKLSDLRGKVVVVDFWAVWCGPCIRAFPHLRDWHKKYADRGVQVVGVTTYFKNLQFDKKAGKLSRASETLTPKQEQEMLKDFAEYHKLPYPLLVLSSAGWEKAAQDYGIEGIPTLVVIDQEGVVRLIQVGLSEAGAHQVDDEITQLLKKE